MNLFSASALKETKTQLLLAVLVFVLFLLTMGGVRYSSGRKAANSILADSLPMETLIGWDHPEYQLFWKDKFWIENQLLLAKDDSMSLGINFSDSLFQLQFKGLPLIKTKMMALCPASVRTETNADTYQKLYNHPWTVVEQQSNKIKKPFRKMTVNADGTTNTEEDKNRVEEPLRWTLVCDNNFRLVVSGIISDSLNTQPNPRWEMIKYRMSSKLINPEKPADTFYPTIFIWLNNADAIAIYRALPENAKLIVHN